MKSNQPIAENDLQWLAYLYVTGELSPEDVDSFERRLDDDQAAREAVADAMQLHDGLIAAGAGALADVATPRSVVRKRVAGVMASIAAVVACIVLAQPETVVPPKQPDESAAAADREAASTPDESKSDHHLAELWATQWEDENREVATADQWPDAVQSHEVIPWDDSFDDEGPASWMWEALDITVADSEDDMELPEEESL